jgi:glycosyltransferase involved in cell wall biosynthesis
MNAVAAEFLKQGQSVHYAVLDDGTEDRVPTPPSGVRVHRLQVPSRAARAGRLRQWSGFSYRFARLVRAERPDLVHTNFAVPGIAARAIARGLGVRTVITTYHELCGSLNPLLRRGLSATSWTCDRRIFVSSACAASFGHREAPVFGTPETLPAGREIVIRNGFAYAPPDPAEIPPRAIERPRLIAAGRLMPEKGFHLLVDAVRRLCEAGRPVDVEIIGEGPVRAALEQQIAAANLVGQIRLPGWRSHAELMAAFAGADLVVIPSDGTQESFGLVLAEAMAVANRLVASDIAPFLEVVSCLERAAPPAGISLFRANDSADLTRALASALDAEPEPEAVAQRQAAAVTTFDLRRMGRLYAALYTQLLDQAHAS